MSIPGKAVLVSMGVFWGVIMFGVNVSLTHFNRLVEPERPLHLLEWRVDKNELEIQLLGESYHLVLSEDSYGQLRHRYGEMGRAVVDGAESRRAAAQREITESGWPEKAAGLWERVTGYVSVKIEQLK